MYFLTIFIGNRKVIHMGILEQHHELVAKQVIQNLAKRHMQGFYCKTAEEAVELASSLMKEGSSVSWGGTMTMKEIGLLDAIKSRKDLQVLDRSTANTQEEIDAMYRQVFSADNFIMSTNAITLEGELLNIDGTGNRVAALIFGPKQVIVIAGMNKVCKDLDEAMTRVRNIASPPNCIRLDKTTPCAVTGVCGDCLGDDCICNQIVTTRNSRDPERIKVILVEGSWGY